MAMEEGAEYFSIGSIVSCKTCYDKEIEGEVLAFDALTKMLIIKRPASCGRSALNDIHVINLAKVSEVQVRKEGPSPPPLPPNPNTERLRRRACSEVEKKQHLIKALSAGVSPEGQGVFQAIRKTINEVKWQGLNIHVMDLTITPPYLSENIKGDGTTQAYNHVKKIVEKHHKEMAKANESDFDKRNSRTSSPGTPQ